MLTKNHFLGLLISSLVCQLLMVLFSLDTITPNFSEDRDVRSYVPKKILRNRAARESFEQKYLNIQNNYDEKIETIQWMKTLVIVISVIVSFTFCYHSFFLDWEKDKQENKKKNDAKENENDDEKEEEDTPQTAPKKTPRKEIKCN